MKARTGDHSGREAPALNEIRVSAELLALNRALDGDGGAAAEPLLDELARELRTAGARVQSRPR